MNYRPFGKLDWQVSALGFGCMRLPILDGKTENIDEALATRMLHHGIDQGINYVDTAYPYHKGASEPFVGRALQGGYRQKVRLATKMPSWLVESAQDFDRFLNEQLQRLQTDHIDFYLLHALNAKHWSLLKQFNVLEWVEKAIASGRIGHIGFSFHDAYPTFEQIVDDYDRWTFCQIQYNYMDINEQAGTKGLRYAAEQGLAVVVMEPLRGGRLATPPQVVADLFPQKPIQRTPADWALQWLWNQTQVTTVLSGMSTFEQVEQNLVSADTSAVGSLSEKELKVIVQVRQKYLELCPIPCTQCEYCLPCPNGVDIPGNFAMFNEAVMLDDWGGGRWNYNNTDENKRASACLDCKECEDKCPQQIAISEWLPYVHAVLGKESVYDGRRQP